MNDLATRQAIVTSLADFAAKPLPAAATALFESLGYRSQKRLTLKPNTPETFVATFAKEKPLHPEHALLADWQSVDLLFQLTDEEVQAAAGGDQQFLFDSKGKYSGAAMESYLFFAITLKQPHYTRTELSGITRAVNRLFPMPAMLLFRHGDTLTLAVINRRLHKLDSAKDVLEKVTLIKDIRFATPHRAHIEILADLSFDALREKHDFANFVALHAAWQKCLDSSELNKRFFQEIANWYFWALGQVTFPKPKDIRDPDDYKSQSVIRLITRLIFCWFVKEKGLIPNTLFDQRKLAEILHGFTPAKTADKESVFYKAILQNLFFATLNQEMNTPDKPDSRKFRGRSRQKGGRDPHHMIHNVYRYEDAFQNPAQTLQIFATIPFLNGGLFECLDKQLDNDGTTEGIRIDGFSDHPKNPLCVPDFLFFGPEKEGEEVGLDWEKIYGRRPQNTKIRGLIHTFDHYKFTVAENTPIEEEIALDPELSGKVFENLLAAYNPETGATARKQTGSFFTPREIVNYMVDEALIAYLKTKLEAAEPTAKDVEARLRHLFAYNNESHKFSAQEVDALIAAIDGLKSLDPAVGSGAFPMGILHKLVFILGKLDPHNEKWRERQRHRAISETEEAFKVGDKEERLHRLEDINEVFESNASDYGRKLYLIENCIYGVDIQPIAVQIAKMRFFISLIVDQKIDDTQPNRGVLPLPNLETKFVAANTLIGIERPETQGKLFSNAKVDKLKSDLSAIRHRMFTAKTPSTKQTLREKDKAVRLALAEEIQKSLVKANEDEMRQTRLEIEKARKALQEEQSKPVQWETTRLTNLFGETEETRIDPAKEKKRHLQEQVKHLESSILRATQRDNDIDATARRLASWNPYDQNASADFFDAEWMFGLPDGFDILIGNPPYGAELSEEHKEILKKTFEHIVERIRNSFLYFIGAGYGLTKPQGVVCYILPNEFLFQIYMTKARRFFLDNAQYLFAINVGETVFEAIVPTCVVAFKKIKLASYPIPVADLRECQYEELTERLDTKLFPLSSSDIIRATPNSIFAFDLQSTSLVNKLSANFTPFENFCEDVANGISTSCDETYIVTKEFARGESLEKKYLKECIRGGQFNRFYCPPETGEYVLYITDDFDPKTGKKIHQYLSRNKSLLVKKCVEKNSGSRDWHVLFRSRYEGLFRTPKILVRQTGDKIIAAPDTEVGYYCIDSVNVVLLKQAAIPQLRLFVALLNSSLLNFFYREISQEGGRVLAQVKPQRIRALPIAEASPEAQKIITKLVDRILAAKRKNPDADTKALEREIDQQVYALYGLTPDEIKIVAGAEK